MSVRTYGRRSCGRRRPTGYVGRKLTTVLTTRARVAIATRFTTCDECESVDACQRLRRCAKGWFRAARKPPCGHTNTSRREEVEADGIYEVIWCNHCGETLSRRKIG